MPIPIQNSKNSIIGKMLNFNLKITVPITKHHCLRKNIILKMNSSVSKIKKDKS